MKDRQYKIIDLLFKLATEVEPVAHARLAAAVVYKNDIVSFGINKLKSHPLQAKFSKNPQSIYAHAEISAIRNALRIVKVEDLSKCSLFIARAKYPNSEANHFIQGMAKPCGGCRGAINNFFIKNVYFTLDNVGYGVI